jgi:hypothetical protein
MARHSTAKDFRGPDFARRLCNTGRPHNASKNNRGAFLKYSYLFENKDLSSQKNLSGQNCHCGGIAIRQTAQMPG